MNLKFLNEYIIRFVSIVLRDYIFYQIKKIDLKI